MPLVVVLVTSVTRPGAIRIGFGSSVVDRSVISCELSTISDGMADKVFHSA